MGSSRQIIGDPVKRTKPRRLVKGNRMLRFLSQLVKREGGEIDITSLWEQLAVLCVACVIFFILFTRCSSDVCNAAV